MPVYEERQVGGGGSSTTMMLTFLIGVLIIVVALVVAAIGRARVPIHPSKIKLSFGGVPMVRGGVGLGPGAERRIAKVFQRKEFTIAVGLDQGAHSAHLWTTDLSYDYVRIN